MYNIIGPEKLDIQYSTSEIGISDYLEKEINRRNGFISVGCDVKRSISFLMNRLTIFRIKFSRKRLESNFHKIYRTEKTFYQPKNSQK